MSTKGAADLSLFDPLKLDSYYKICPIDFTQTRVKTCFIQLKIKKLFT